MMILGNDNWYSGSDPSDPLDYAGFGSTERKRRCSQVPLYGSQILNGRLTVMSSPRTFTQCVTY